MFLKDKKNQPSRITQDYAQKNRQITNINTLAPANEKFKASTKVY